MANHATAGNTTNQSFGMISGPFGPTPLLPPFAVAPGTGFLGASTGVATLQAGGTLPGGLGAPTAGPNNILTPDNARDNASAKTALGPNHPLTFNGG